MASRAAADAENDILTFLRNDPIAVDRSITLSTSAAGRRLAALPELRGKDLVCWCAPDACHGDVLLELANARP